MRGRCVGFVLSLRLWSRGCAVQQDTLRVFRVYMGYSTRGIGGSFIAERPLTVLIFTGGKD